MYTVNVKAQLPCTFGQWELHQCSRHDDKHGVPDGTCQGGTYLEGVVVGS